ncbi:hypothetical protein EBS02_00520 [bacterium]|nr:hypothetical protein [bacterium]
MNQQILLSQIKEIDADLGQPDCQLINPFLVDQSTETIIPWLLNFSSQDIFMIHSDKILTIASPSPKFLKLYEDSITE